MRRYYKEIEDGWITAVYAGGSGENEITKEEYDAILSLVRSCPAAPEGYEYKLKTDLTWELAQAPAVETEDDAQISDSEALDIILGGEG